MNSRIADSSSISLRSYLVKGTMGTFILLIAATGLGFLTNLILARILGVAEYGAYAFAFSGVGLLTVISMFGMTNILIRNISAYSTEEKWGLLRGIKIWALSRGAVSSILMSLFAGLIIWLISDRIDDQLLLVSWIALFAVPLLVVSNLIMSILHGLKRVVLSKVPGTVVRAPFFILLVLLVNKTIFPLKAASAAALNIFSILAALALSWLLLLRSSTRQMRENEPEYDRKGWTSSAIPLLVVDIFNVAMACVPVLALGVIAGAESAGVFSVANVISSIIGFVLIAVNAIIGPVI
ncbi:MAG: oligosaccharide flippase family protein [Nitrospirota bacterium]|nr:MAG: oligosaccharide flippase family protein [Nitrospirota bacterium]